MSTNLLAIVAGTLAPALLFVPAIIQSSRERERAERRREDESRARDAAREKEKEGGEAVRRIVYRAYIGMAKERHAHGLDMLTAIISRVGVGCPPEIARFALEQTRERLSRFDCKPINKALDELKSFEV